MLQFCVICVFSTHRMCVRAVGTEGKGDGWIKDAKLPYHLLHTSDGALLVRVGKLDHQAGRSTLKGGKIKKGGLVVEESK